MGLFQWLPLASGGEPGPYNTGMAIRPNHLDR